MNTHIISNQATVKEVLQRINELQHGSMTVFVTDNDGVMCGTVTDGDIRRGLLNQVQLADPVAAVMNTAFKYLRAGDFNVEELRRYKARSISLLPVLDSAGRLVDVIDLTVKKTWLPMQALIMAGGEGQRLRPITLETPKPMIPVGDKPILEHNISRLSQYGISSFYISVKYLRDKIMDYFGDGQDRKLNIQYVVEDEPLGTIGSLSLIDELRFNHVLVMNADVLTNIDFEDMFLAVTEADADMAVASYGYEVKIPYGVIETSDELITGLKEKPVYTYFSNAGIYIVHRRVLAKMEKGKKLNATDLMEMLIRDGGKVLNYPIRGYWLDIGGHEALKKAQEDIQHLEF